MLSQRKRTKAKSATRICAMAVVEDSLLMLRNFVAQNGFVFFILESRQKIVSF